MKVAEIIRIFDDYAPFRYQESYDNSGLQVGDPGDEVKGALLSLDITEAVLDEAIAKNCNLVIAHHPLIFSGIKNLTGRNYVQRIVQKAIKNDINLLAVHTNLDNMRQGVNKRIADRLGLQETRILAPVSGNLLKLCTYVPSGQAEHLRTALFTAGAGHIGQYSECSFSSTGSGTFRGSKDSKPFIGVAGGMRENIQEDKIEVLVPVHVKNQVEQALLAAHPYEEVAYDWLQLQNHNPETGAGMTGSLPGALTAMDFLALLKKQMKTAVVRHTALPGKPVQKIAVCGGSGSFLLKDAIAAGADVFVTSDFKYHQFFDAEGKILIADIGHFESEQFTVEIFDDILKKKNVTFAVLLSTLDTNPIKYF